MSKAKAYSDMRDVSVADDIMQMADMGFFDLLLTAYGTAYWEQDHVTYLISPTKDSLYTHIMSLREEGYTPTKIISQQTFIPNLAGTEEVEQGHLEYETGYNLSELVVADELEAMSQLAAVDNSTIAEPLFSDWQERLIGYFYYPDLQMFSATLTDAYIAKKISPQFYHQTKDWVTGQLHQVSSEIVLPGPGYKTFWGFAHWLPESPAINYSIDGNYAATLAKWEKLRSEGRITSPLYQKTLALKEKHTPLALREPFLKAMKDQFDADFIEKINALHHLPAAIKRADYEDLLKRLKSDYIQESFLLYEKWWGL